MRLSLKLGFFKLSLLLLIPAFSLLTLIHLRLDPYPYVSPIYSGQIEIIHILHVLLMVNSINVVIFLPFLCLIPLPSKLSLVSLAENSSDSRLNSLIVFYLCLLSGPLVALSGVFFTSTIIYKIGLLFQKLFTGAWFFSSHLPNRYKYTLLCAYFISLYFSFISGNRSSIIFPLVFFLLGYLASCRLSLFALCRSLNRWTYSILNFKLSFINIRFFLAAFLFFLASISRALRNTDAFVALGSLLDGFSNPFDLFSFAFLITLRRLIPWHFFSVLMQPENFYYFANIKTDFLFYFSDFRSSLDSAINSEVYLGIFNRFGWSPATGYTIPSIFFIEGAAQAGYFGFTLYCILYCILIFSFARYSLILKHCRLLSICYLITYVFYAPLSEPLFQIIKSGFLFLFISLAFSLLVSSVFSAD